MNTFGPFAPQVEAMHNQLADYPVQPRISGRVLQLSLSTASWGTSPVESVNVIAGTLVASATGMAKTFGSQISIHDCFDREDLQGAIIAMRGAADVFEAMLKAGRQ